MSLILYHHPFSRAAGVVWTLEELGRPYELKFVDIMKGAQKAKELTELNPMGKIPLLVDGDVVVTESAAISLYLADRYASGELAPKLDDPRRGTYLRWALFAPSVIEPGSLAHTYRWEYKPGQAGWGDHDSMLAAIDAAVTGKEYLLGHMFSIADVIFGGTLRYMVRVKALSPSPPVTEYLARLEARPALQRADERNAAVVKDHGLGR